MLTFSDVSKRFGAVQALSDCSFSVARGRMLGFLGPNGAGKTTAMRAVFGLVELDARRGALGRAAVGLARAAALRLHAGGARPLSADAGRRAARLLRLPARARRERGARGGIALARAARSRRPRRREGRGALARQPAARAARGGAAARAGAARPRRAVRRARPGRRAHARRGAPRRGGPRRRRPLLQPSARARRGHLRGGRDHRPRPHRRHRRRGRAETRLAAAADRAPARGRTAGSGCRTSPASSWSSAATATCGCWPAETSTRSRCSRRRSGRRGSSRSATGRRRSPSSSWSWWRHERAARDHARRPARDPRAPAQPRVPRLDAGHAPARRRVDRA